MGNDGSPVSENLSMTHQTGIFECRRCVVAYNFNSLP